MKYFFCKEKSGLILKRKCETRENPETYAVLGIEKL